MKKVFVSYTQSDEDAVRQMVTELERNGFDVWFAPSKLMGAERLSTITDRIASSDYVVVVWSKASINSEWVKHESNVAIALSLGGNPLKVIPVLFDQVPQQTAFADIVSINLAPQHYQSGITELLAVLKGEKVERRSIYSKFQDYVKDLVYIEHGFYISIIDLEPFRRTTIHQAARSGIAERLEEAGASDEDRDRILKDFNDGRPMPIVDESERDLIRTWLRQGDEELVTLAAELWRCIRREHLEGVTTEWISKDFFLRCDELRGTDNYGAKNEWRVEGLISRAKNIGLLATSTEWRDPRTYAYLDMQANPGFDMGPMAWTVGRLAYMFEVAEGMRKDDLI